MFSKKKGLQAPDQLFSAGVEVSLRVWSACYYIFVAVFFLGNEHGATAIQCNTITFLILKIEVCFSLYVSKFTPWVGQIYPQRVYLPPVKNPCASAMRLNYVQCQCDLVENPLCGDLVVILSSECSEKRSRCQVQKFPSCVV